MYGKSVPDPIDERVLARRWKRRAAVFMAATFAFIGFLYTRQSDPRAAIEADRAAYARHEPRQVPDGIRVPVDGPERVRLAALTRAVQSSGEACDTVREVRPWGSTEAGELWRVTCGQGSSLVETHHEIAIRVVGCDIAAKIGADCSVWPKLNHYDG